VNARRIGQQANKFQWEKLANVFNMKGGAVFEQDLGCCPHEIGAPRLLVKLNEEIGVEWSFALSNFWTKMSRNSGEAANGKLGG
jgi:hypothetical protein